MGTRTAVSTPAGQQSARHELSASFSGKLHAVEPNPDDASVAPALPESEPCDALPAAKAAEVGGRDGPEPTRYGDWELRGRCIDF